jgi:hypothetical protein
MWTAEWRCFYKYHTLYLINNSVISYLFSKCCYFSKRLESYTSYHNIMYDLKSKVHFVGSLQQRIINKKFWKELICLWKELIAYFPYII